MLVPDFFEKILIEQYGKEIFENIINGYFLKRNITFRVNNLKSNYYEIKKILDENNIQFENVEWNQDAFIIKNVSKREIEELEIYKLGKIYLQSLSSMLPPIILEPQENADILDMAAAPRRKNNSNCGYN